MKNSFICLITLHSKVAPEAAQANEVVRAETVEAEEIVFEVSR